MLWSVLALALGLFWPVFAPHCLKEIAQIRLVKSKTKHLPITTYLTRGKWLQ